MIALLRGIPPSAHTQQRLLEILPGALTWFVLLVPVLTAFAIRLNDPGQLWILGVAAVVLDLYWLGRTTYTVRCVRRSLRTLERATAQDWWATCRELEASLPEGAPRPRDVVHCALIPTYTERYEVLQATVGALASQNYPAEQRVCAIITRATDHGGVENVTRLRDEFGDRFRAFIHIRDPLLPGIVQSDSSLPKDWTGKVYFKADSLDALANRIGVDATGLMETIRKMNSYAASGVDSEFGKGSNSFDRYYGDTNVKPNPCLAPIVKSPFYALRIDAGDIGTKGGLLTDEFARVLRADGQPIAGLYATGNTSAAVMGPSYPGAGSTIGPAMTFGFVAAHHLAGI